MSTYKNILILMSLKELNMIFKVIGDMSIVVGLLSIFKVVELNSQIPFTGIQLIMGSSIPYGISILFAYLCSDMN